jgi:hypothetical protein
MAVILNADISERESFYTYEVYSLAIFYLLLAGLIKNRIGQFSPGFAKLS